MPRLTLQTSFVLIFGLTVMAQESSSAIPPGNTKMALRSAIAGLGKRPIPLAPQQVRMAQPAPATCSVVREVGPGPKAGRFTMQIVPAPTVEPMPQVAVPSPACELSAR